ncbi:MAG: RNA polymerase sigma factor [Daejeonella sp.]
MFKTPEVSETELIRKCKESNLKNQEKLYKHFYGYAMGIGLRYLSNREDVLEVVNDAFIKVFISIKNFDEEQPFKPWFRKILVNTAIDRRRKDLKYLEQVDIEKADDVLQSSAAIETLTVKDILLLLNRLPEMQRIVFNLYEIDGYSHDEIGQTLNITASSSRVYLSRAKEKLKKTWTEQENYERIS